MSKVTAITSVYKSEKYLSGYFNNIDKQQFDDFDVFIELNEPSIQEKEKFQQFSDKRKNVKLNISETLKTMSASWNTCINNSDSEYICLWNVDDQRSKRSIQYLSETLDNDKSIDFVYGHYYNIKSYRSFNRKLVDMSNKSNMLKIGMILGPFFMFRRTLLNSAGLFDEQLYSGADYDFAIRIAHNGKSKYIKKNLGYFLDEGLGASTRPDSKQALERTLVELRYNIRILDENLVNFAKKYYDVENIYFNNKSFAAKDFINGN